MTNPPQKPPIAERRRSPRRRAEDDLPDFRDLVENSVQGILVHRNFRPLYANEAFARLFGYDGAKDVVALPLIRPLVPADIWPRTEESYDDLIHGRKKATASRMRGVRRDGGEFWMAVTERVIDWHGTPAVQMTAFDISGQMAVEQQMLDNEQRMRAMFEVLPYPLYIARQPDGQLLFVNRKTCLLFEKSAGQLLRGTSIDFFIDGNDRMKLSDLLASLGDIRDIEVKMKTAQGREFTAEIAAIGMNFGGAPAALVALNDISERKRLEAELFREASTDALTGVNNRRYFLAQAEQELRRARRFGRPMAVMMIDLDHFKRINDKHGHAGGDAVLQAVVKISFETLRQSDMMGRLGGEEFAVILPETGLAPAADVANRLRRNIAARPVVTGPGSERQAVECSVSIGVAQLETQDGSIDDLLHRADRALYRAKEQGRNRVETAS